MDARCCTRWPGYNAPRSRATTRTRTWRWPLWPETVDDHHEADDPVLCLILREIAVRAAVELARAETPAAPALALPPAAS